MVSSVYRISAYIPGLALLVITGLAAKYIATTVLDVNVLLLAILVGVGIANTVGVPNSAKKGADTHKIFLEAGIVVMGGRLLLGQLLTTGTKVGYIVLLVVTLSLVYVETLSRYVFRLADKLGSVLAAGMSICGVSAVVAVAGAIKAEEDHIAYAVAAVLLFDSVTLFAYPLVGNLLGLSSQEFGVWAGVSMLSTGPAAAAGFLYSDVAGQWATLTKLARNVLIGFVAIGYSLFYSTQQGSSGEVQWRYLWDSFPKFVIGFVIVMVLSTAGLFSESQITSLRNGYRWLFLFAFTGLGLQINIRELRNIGFYPVALLAVSLTTISFVSLLTVLAVF